MDLKVKQSTDHAISPILNLNITNDGSCAAIGIWCSNNIEIINMKTYKKVETIEAQNFELINCYFIEGNKAVSIDNCNLICLDISDI